ncbi:HD domain-containing protein [Novosphingobium sp.]|uniref:HD domain-containing protein n=1 Tax=Novosphingobium sp. TaxID=1874826 RepID=UPI00260D57F7|nr:HD domain-containing protein [Novosphingobium sp.]
MAVETVWRDDEEWERLPLFPELPPTPALLLDSEDRVFTDPFLAELAHTRPLQRLKNIGFLGALDYIRLSNGSDFHRRRHNRYDHSLGVAELALLYADIRGLNRYDSRVLAAAGLLHDIGHGPLSHTLEPVFNANFGINHHKAGTAILEGKTALGGQIHEIMTAYQVDLDEVVAMIDGTHPGAHAFLFASPINLDTIEGISRSRLFAAKATRPFNPKRLVALIAAEDAWPTKAADEFWRLKDSVYNLIIHHPHGLLFDGLAQAYMSAEISQFRPAYFLWNEEQLRSRQPELFSIFAWARKSKRRALNRLSEKNPKIFEHSLKAPVRSFAINEHCRVNQPDDLKIRYVQSKISRSVTIAELVGSMTINKAVLT